MSAYLLNHQDLYKRHNHIYFLEKALSKAGAQPEERALFNYLMTPHYRFQSIYHFDLRACTVILFKFPPPFQALLLLNLYRYEIDYIASKEGVESKAPELIQRSQLLSNLTKNPWGRSYLRLFAQPLNLRNYEYLSSWLEKELSPIPTTDIGLLIKETFNQLEYYQDYRFLTYLAQTNDIYTSAGYIVEALGYSPACKQEILGIIQQWPLPTDTLMPSPLEQLR